MITDRLIAIGAGAAAVIAATAAGIFAWQAHSSDKALALCNEVKTTLLTKVDEQNRSIEMWSRVAKSSQEQASAAFEQAKEVSKAKQGQIGALQTALRASPGMSCTDAVKRVREGLKP